jgi:metal-responsive CopG/Arc/MetJ family transcriptional regulator
MRKATGVIMKRPKETGTLVGVRFQEDLLKRLDSWRAGQEDVPNRPEAIRRLVERGTS